MRSYKKVIIPFMLIVCMLISSLPVCAANPSEPSEPSGVWYAPYGGTWTVTEAVGSNLVLHPYKVVYITYDQLALIQANALTSSDLTSLANLARDQGVAKVSEWLAKKLGKSAAAKFIPYIGYAVLAYDYFNGLSSLATDARYAQAISARHGIRIEYGTTFGSPYTAYDDWTTNYVYNPQGFRGTFTANKK